MKSLGHLQHLHPLILMKRDIEQLYSTFDTSTREHILRSLDTTNTTSDRRLVLLIQIEVYRKKEY